MRRLAATGTTDLHQLSASRWRGTGPEPGFIFDVAHRRSGFACFFLRSANGSGPRITFDHGSGFTELSALSLKSFPFAFYHLPIERVGAEGRLLFRPGTGTASFHFVAFQTSNAILVAILHYLFNLRYQDIGLVAPAGAGPRWRDSLDRIVKFFGDVAKGRGLRVQEDGETLSDLVLALSLKARDVQDRMDLAHAGATVPLLSFVAPTYNTPPAYLRDLVESFLQQNVGYAELILSDDGSTQAATRAYLAEATARSGVRVVHNPSNGGIAIATNVGIAAARGTWVGFIDHDDVFVAGAIAVIADAIAQHSDALFFYTDELVVDHALKPIGVFCKPAYDSVLLSGVNYINHFSIYRRERLDAIGRLRPDREGSQDYDLLLRYLADADPGTIVHIPFVAYMWRREAATYSHVNRSGSIASARRALSSAYEVRGQTVTVEAARDPHFHRIRFAARSPAPLVSIIIANRDSPKLIARILADIETRTDYPAIEIIIVDNGTTDQDTLDLYRRLDRATIDIVVEPFNFAALCNRGAARAKGEVFLFLNNDVKVISPDWLMEMVECLAFDATGIVGARLLYPDGTVQHNGVIVGLGDAAGHWYIGADADDPGPMGRFLVRQTLSAVTGACMLVTRACFEKLDGFDAGKFAIAYNDVDFCLRARNVGIRTVWTPFATLVHHESLSRGSDEVGANRLRFEQEKARLQARHGTRTLIDDAYSPFYDRRESRPYVIVPETLPAPRPNVFR